MCGCVVCLQIIWVDYKPSDHTHILVPNGAKNFECIAKIMKKYVATEQLMLIYNNTLVIFFCSCRRLNIAKIQK